MTHPRQGFEELSINAVKYVEGLPLALKVLGSFLKGRKYVEWKSELEKLQRKPHDKIQKVLRTSFDSLEDNYTQDIFLDIACFFVGMEKWYIMKILEGCGLFPDIGMAILEQRSLLIISGNKLWMHSLIQDMGREIVREQANYVLESYSRLWLDEDVLDILNKHMGSQHVKGLSLNSLVSEDLYLETKAFANMKKLRLLEMYATHLTGNFKHLSSELRWLCWHKCPLKFLPKDFHLENLVVLDLQQSKIIQVWKGYKILNKLKVLNLENSEELIKSPNFSRVPHLEILILQGCTKLVEVHESIGCLKGLVELNLSGCISLSNLPSSIGNLESLRTLDMSYCAKPFEKLEELKNTMVLTKVHGNETTTKQRLSFLGLSQNCKIELCGAKQELLDSQLLCLSYWISPINSIGLCSPLASFSKFRYLEKLNLGYCGFCEDNFPIDLGNLSSLMELDLSGNNFCKTPPGISRLPKLLRLILNDCKALQLISDAPASLWAVAASGTPMLSRFSNSLMKHSPIFSECESHDQVNLLRLISLPFIAVRSDSIKKLSNDGIQFPIIFLHNTEVPDWFSHQAIGSLISFRIPPLSKGLIDEILVCASYGQMPYAPNCTSSDGIVVAISIYNKTKGSNLSLHTKVPLHFASTPCHIYRIPLDFLLADHALRYVVHESFCYSLDSQHIYFDDEGLSKLEIKSGDEMEVSIEFKGGFEVRKCGIQLRPGPSPLWFGIPEDGVVTIKDE